MAKSHNAQIRHRARELAVQLLYSLDARSGQELGESLDVFVSECGFACEEPCEVRDYMFFLVKGTWSKRPDIDNIMRMVVTGWRPERMVAVDRAVLRMMIFEGFLEKNVPFAVAISEAVELARAFGTEDSGKFVNGVLAKVVRHMSADDEVSQDIENKDIENMDMNDAVATSEITADC